MPSDLVVAPPVQQLGRLTVKSATNLGTWGVCLAIYGPAGAGKTPISARVSETEWGGRVLDLDAEGGARSITHMKNVDVTEIKKWDDIEEATANIIRLTQVGKSPWGTIMLDNLSEYSAMCMTSIAGSNIPQIQDWGKMTAKILNLVRVYRDFARTTGVNVIFIAWSAADVDENTKLVRQGVGFNPGIASKFPGILDIVGYLTVESGTQNRILSFAPSPRTDAKFRRALNENAAKIPLVIKFNESHNVLGDILATLKGGVAWPTERYLPNSVATQ